MEAVGDVRLLTTSFKALNGRQGLMADTEQSQLNGYFYNIWFIVHRAMELKRHPLSAFVLVLPRFNENIDSVLWYIISVCLHSDKNMLLHIRCCAVPLS